LASGDLTNSGGGSVSNPQYDFAGSLSFEIPRVTVGTFFVSVFAESDDGFQSTASIIPLTIFRGNHPPELSNLQAPDTVKLNNDAQLLGVHVRVLDADGAAAIAKVVFKSFKPDGTPSSGNPFLLFDDGLSNHGDQVSGDGIYSLTITLPPTTPIGTYRFEFQAFDRSGAGSTIVIHTITVTQ
jgi:hypothetical protein